MWNANRHLRRRLFLLPATTLAAVLLTAATVRAGSVCTWTGTWDTPPSAADDAILIVSGGDLTWDTALPHTVASWHQTETFSNAVIFATVFGATGFTNFTVSGDAVLTGGAWQHVPNPVGAAEVNRLRVTVNGDLSITNASISADQCGHTRGYGPGRLYLNYGGAHGGKARNHEFDLNANIYGSVTNPVNLGSGGGHTGSGGSGGGAIHLTVGGTTSMETNGVITANGQGETFGSGSGGSVLLRTGSLRGGGVIQANGANTVTYGAGGGGRVAVVLTSPEADFADWQGAVTAYGGAGAYAAAAGTVYLKEGDGADSLIVDNNNLSFPGQLSTLMPEGVNLHAFSNVTIRGKGILGINHDTMLDFGTFAPTVLGAGESGIALDSDDAVTYPPAWTINGYTLFGQGISRPLGHLTIGADGVLAHFRNHATETYKLVLTISGDLTVRSNGVIMADGLGYSSGSSPGSANADWWGAAHGGAARDVGTGLNAKTYGSIFAPVNLGSSGRRSTIGPHGGGAILLTVGGTTTVEQAGMISACGLNGDLGSGSGGSVLLTTGWLVGEGTVRADGGQGRASGGGGRVAVVLTAPGAGLADWQGALTAYGGAGTYAAAAGTVYCAVAGTPPQAGLVIADNRNTANNQTFTSLPAFAASTENTAMSRWAARNHARVGLATNAAVWSLELTSNGSLNLYGHTLLTRALTINDIRWPVGTYSAEELGASVLDVSSDGQVVVTGLKQGTIILVR